MRLPWILAGNITYALGQWLLLIILSRSYSSIELGWYFFALSIVSPISLLASLKLPNLVVTLEEEFTLEKYIIFARYLISISIVGISYILYFTFFTTNTSSLILSSVLIYKILEQNDDVTIAYLQKNFSFKEIFFIKLIRTVVYVSCVLISCFFFESLENALLFSTLVYLVFWISRNRNYSIFNIDFLDPLQLTLFKRYIANGIHLSLSSSISSLSTSGIRIYIGYVLGASSLAIFGLVSYNLTAFTILVSALGQYFLPYFVSSLKEPNQFRKYILRSQLSVFIIGLLAIIIAYLLGDQILGIVYGKEYSQYGEYLVLIFISSIFRSSSALIGTAMTATRIYNFQLKFTILSLILTVIFIPIFIYHYGMFGAFYALIIISIIEWLFYLSYYKKRLTRRLNEIN